jgi:hypothetical protein
MIDKSLYEAPAGLETLDSGEPDIEIEIEDPESLSVKIGDMEITMAGESYDDFDENLAESLPDDVVESIVGDLIW